MCDGTLTALELNSGPGRKWCIADEVPGILGKDNELPPL